MTEYGDSLAVLTIDPASESETHSRVNWEVVQRATGILDVLRSEAQSGDENRQITPAALNAMEAEDLFSLMIPTRLGGVGENVSTMVETLTEIARGDGAAAWTAMLMNQATWFGILYGQQAQDELWGNGRKPHMCGIFVPGKAQRVDAPGTQVDGGYLVSGEFPFASGSAVANWAAIGMRLKEESGEETLGLGLLDMADCAIKDTWFTIGMRGTGSNTIVVDQAFIPAYRVMKFDDLEAGRYATPYRAKEAVARQAFTPTIAVAFAAPAVGMAISALEYSLETVPSRGVGYTIYQEARNSPTHQIGIAEAASNIDLARLVLRRAASDIDRWAAIDHYPTDLERARIRMDYSRAADLAKDAVDTLMTVNGARSFAQDDVLGRIWRNINTLARHAYVTPGIAKEVYGRLMLGTADPLVAHV